MVEEKREIKESLVADTSGVKRDVAEAERKSGQAERRLTLIARRIDRSAARIRQLQALNQQLTRGLAQAGVAFGIATGIQEISTGLFGTTSNPLARLGTTFLTGLSFGGLQAAIPALVIGAIGELVGGARELETRVDAFVQQLEDLRREGRERQKRFEDETRLRFAQERAERLALEKKINERTAELVYNTWRQFE